MWHDRFDDSKTTGVESDAYWIGIFLGILVSFGATFVLAFFFIPGALLTELLPLLFVAAIVLSVLLARLLSRTLAAYVARRVASREADR